MARKFRRSLTRNHHARPEKDNRQRQRLHTRSAVIAVQATIQVRASAANGRGVRGEKIEATKRDTREGQGRDRRGEFGCERCWWWCVTVVRACARRCGLRGHCDGQSTARARGGAKAAPPRVAGVLLYGCSEDRPRLERKKKVTVQHLTAGPVVCIVC